MLLVELGEEVGGVVGFHLLEDPGGPFGFHGLEDLGLVLLGELLEDVGQVLVLHGLDQLLAGLVGQVLHVPGGLGRVQAAQLDQLGGRLADVEELARPPPTAPGASGPSGRAPGGGRA